MAYVETRTLKTGITYRVCWRADGRKQHSPAYNTLKEAEDYKTLLEAEEITTGRVRDLAKPQTPFRDVAELWFVTRKLKDEDTWKKERSVLNAQLLPEFGDKPIGSITIDDVQAFVSDSDAAPASMATYYSVLGQVMRWAELRDYLTRRCPVGKGLVTLPTGDQRMIWLKEHEVEHLFDTTREHHKAHYPLIHLEAHTGMRLGEILGLSRDSYNSIRRTIQLDKTKTRNPRTIALFDCCVEVLNSQLAGHDHDVIFPGPGGTLQNGSNWRKRVWYPVRKSAGFEEIDLHFHDLRHTHASWLLQNGWDVVNAAARLGHKSAKMTLDVYGHTDVSGQERYTAARANLSRVH
jgi:integrase